MSYGALQRGDIEVLEAVLEAIRPSGKCRFLEIGIYDGHTARGVQEWCRNNNVDLDYWGIDDASLCSPKPPFPGATLIVGNSIEVFYLVPKDLNVVFVDGNHSCNHAILDTLHYGARVVDGGFMVFHDTAPHLQHTMREPGPDIPEFYNAVNQAHDMLNFPFEPWTMFKRCLGHRDDKFGGMTAFRKQCLL